MFAKLKEIKPSLLKSIQETKFIGYEDLNCEAKILVLLTSTGEITSQLKKGESGFIIFDQTSFFAFGGGQDADNGNLITTAGVKVLIDDVRKDIVEGYYLHEVQNLVCDLKINQEVNLEVNQTRRNACSKNHSAIHSTWAMIYKKVGYIIPQVGSRVCEDKYLLEYEPDDVLSEELVLEVTNALNSEVFSQDIKSKIYYLTEKEATEKGYLLETTKIKDGELARIVDFPGVITEGCGGTHVGSLKDISQVYFLDYDRNKKRILIEMTSNYEAVVAFFENKLVAKVEEIKGLVSKIRVYDSNYVLDDLDFNEIIKEENWNHLTVKSLNELYNEVNKVYSKYEKENQKKLMVEFSTYEFERHEVEINELKGLVFFFTDSRFDEKLMIGRIMRLLGEFQNYQLIGLYNKSLETLLFATNDKNLNLINKVRENEIYQVFKIDGGGNPKMVIFYHINEEELLIPTLLEAILK